MNKYLKWTLLVLAVLVIGLWLAFRYMTANTKKMSPEHRVEYKTNDREIKLFFNSPSKRGREIFGALVPFGEVWRTGANEPTTFTTATDLTIAGKVLPAGTYSIWTKPEADKWTVYFNSGEYPWGVSWGGKASREADKDVLEVEVAPMTLEEVQESLVISIEENPLRMRLAWDLTAIEVVLE